MKASIKILLLLAGLFFVASSAFGDDATNYLNSGVLKLNKGDLDGALADFNKAIELNPKYPNPYDGRGNVESIKSDWNGALTDFNKAIELDPNDVYAYNERGLVKSQKEDNFNGALADINKAIELNPNYGQAYDYRGRIETVQGNQDRALADFNKPLN